MTRAARIRTIGLGALAALGTVTLVGLIVGSAIDISRFDETEGGYEAPFENVTGPTLDWAHASISPEGFVQPGIIMDMTVNCTTGMVGATMFGFNVDYRVLSERAIVVHKPREACIEAGFSPQF